MGCQRAVPSRPAAGGYWCNQMFVRSTSPPPAEPGAVATPRQAMTGRMPGARHRPGPARPLMLEADTMRR